MDEFRQNSDSRRGRAFTAGTPCAHEPTNAGDTLPSPPLSADGPDLPPAPRDRDTAGGRPGQPGTRPCAPDDDASAWVAVAGIVLASRPLALKRRLMMFSDGIAG
jgi:hypothetical protein